MNRLTMTITVELDVDVEVDYHDDSDSHTRTDWTIDEVHIDSRTEDILQAIVDQATDEAMERIVTGQA